MGRYHMLTKESNRRFQPWYFDVLKAYSNITLRSRTLGVTSSNRDLMRPASSLVPLVLK